MNFSLVECSICKKSYLKDIRHVNENIKLGNNFYCSPDCFSKAKNKQKEFVCENPGCKNRFTRSPNKVSIRNFCSNICAMKIIGPENGMKNKKYRFCRQCKTALRTNQIYCSNKCWALAHRIPPKTLIIEVISLSRKLGRTPTRREYKHYSSASRLFGSWSKFLDSAGLIPNRNLNQHMFVRKLCVAKDKHVCNSISELIIDNWLTKRKIPHLKEIRYPNSNFIADWMLGVRTYVEYFGLAGDSIRYDKDISRKRILTRQLGIKLIEIYSKDIYSKNNLDKIFKEYKSCLSQKSGNQSLISLSASSGDPEA